MLTYRRTFRMTLQHSLDVMGRVIACRLCASPAFSQTAQLTDDPVFLFEDVPIPVSQPCSVGGMQAYVRQLNMPSYLAIDQVYYRRLVSECGVLAVPILIEALENPQENIRANAALAIGQVGAETDAAIPALIEALGDESDMVQTNAAYALGQMGWMAESALPALKEQLENEDRAVIASAADAIGQIGASLVENRLFEIYGEVVEINEYDWGSWPEASSESQAAAEELLEATYLELYVPLSNTWYNLYSDRISNPEAWRQANGEMALLSTIDAIAAIGMMNELYSNLNVNYGGGGVTGVTPVTVIDGGAQLVAAMDSHLATNRPAICRVTWLGRVIIRCRN